MVSTIGVAMNDNSEACDNTFLTGHLMGRNLVKSKFLSKDSRLLLTWYAQIDQRKTVNKRPVTVFWKLAIFLATMTFGANFTVKAPKRRSDWSAAKHFLKTKIPRLLTIFCKLVIVFFVMGLKRSFKVRVPKCRFDESNRRTRWIRRLKGVWHYFAYWSSFWS